MAGVIEAITSAVPDALLIGFCAGALVALLIGSIRVITRFVVRVLRRS